MMCRYEDNCTGKPLDPILRRSVELFRDVISITDIPCTRCETYCEFYHHIRKSVRLIDSHAEGQVRLSRLVSS